jgi:hypothetical protein
MFITRFTFSMSEPMHIKRSMKGTRSSSDGLRAGSVKKNI